MNQIYQAANPYPPSRAFVLKLHRETDLAAGVVRGRIEHVASGSRGEFNGLDQLLGWLAHGLEQDSDDTLVPLPLAGRKPS